MLLRRWVCTSALQSDLEKTDKIAADVLEHIVAQGGIGFPAGIEFILMYG